VCEAASRRLPDAHKRVPTAIPRLPLLQTRIYLPYSALFFRQLLLKRFKGNTAGFAGAFYKQDHKLLALAQCGDFLCKCIFGFEQKPLSILTDNHNRILINGIQNLVKGNLPLSQIENYHTFTASPPHRLTASPPHRLTAAPPRLITPRDAHTSAPTRY
jgi:hypothetical protein